MLDAAPESVTPLYAALRATPRECWSGKQKKDRQLKKDAQSWQCGVRFPWQNPLFRWYMHFDAVERRRVVKHNKELRTGQSSQGCEESCEG